jgi:thioredoxin-related protein
MNVREGGTNAVEKFNWLRDYHKGKRILYLVFWSDAFKPYLADMEYAKRLNKRYRNKITFVFLSLDDDDARWQQTVARFNYSSDGIINYRIGSKSPIAKQFKVNAAPAFVLISKSGETIDLAAKTPSNAALEEEFKNLLDQ